MIFNHYHAETYREEQERRLQFFLLKRVQEKFIVDAPATRIKSVQRLIRQTKRWLINVCPPDWRQIDWFHVYTKANRKSRI